MTLRPIPREERCGYKRRKAPDEKWVSPAVTNSVPKGCQSKETLRLEWFGVIARADYLNGRWQVKAWTSAGPSETNVYPTREDAIRELGARFAAECFPRSLA